MSDSVQIIFKMYYLNTVHATFRESNYIRIFKLFKKNVLKLCKYEGCKTSLET